MTGLWFVRRLSAAGHRVFATFTRANAEAYNDPLRRQRVALALEHAVPVFNCRFGDATFREAITHRQIDVLCHHGAEVTDYKSLEFDVCKALANNAHQIAEVLRALVAIGARRVVLSGSVFEGGEGAGSDGLPSLSPYGLSKALTSQMFADYCRREGVALGKFVIPNPFGPYEEPRFTTYLARRWQDGETPTVRTPAYVRDNIHVSLLAAAYRRFVEHLSEMPGFTRYNPSGYVESQGAFAERFARAMEPRLGVACPLELVQQTEFTEPKVRINTDSVDAAELAWDEVVAWDELADYYRACGATGV